MKKICTLYGEDIYANTTDEQKLRLITRYLKNQTGIFTNLPNEITGSTHYDKKTDWVAVAIVAVMVLAALLIIGEQTGLTSWLFGTV